LILLSLSLASDHVKPTKVGEILFQENTNICMSEEGNPQIFLPVFKNKMKTENGAKSAGPRSVGAAKKVTSDASERHQSDDECAAREREISGGAASGISSPFH
jgi:hypothetical protein